MHGTMNIKFIPTELLTIYSSITDAIKSYKLTASWNNLLWLQVL